jgi:hypothetical protein
VRKMRLKLLEKSGYKKIDSYSLKLYSSILDKIISNFNDVTNILIPYDGDVKDLVVLYIKDDGILKNMMLK